MKFSKLGLGLLALIAITFTACSPEEVLLRNIQGEWAMTGYVVSGTVSETENGETTETGSITGTATNIDLIFNFEEGTYTTSGNFDLTLDFSVGGFSFSFPVPDASTFDTGVYSISETTITLDPNSGDALMGTLEISRGMMTISYEEVETEVDGSVTTTETSLITMTFEEM